MNDEQLATLTISMGDPAGIGPEVAVKALADPQTRRLARWILVGDAWLIDEWGRRGGFQPDRIVTALDDAATDGSVVVFDARQVTPAQLRVGQVDAACGQAALEYVRQAVELCLAGRAAGIVTAPVSKEAVALTRPNFVGHTEYIGDLCGVADPCLMLVNDYLRVVHVSTHCSLARAAQLSRERILRALQLGYAAMTLLGWERPRIAVCGLNPHASEHGLFGNEEATIIAPAIEDARAQGIPCEGPFPADTLFLQAVRGKYDLLVAMYHDQGHIPMKLLDFEHTVNVTLGLPIIRTSVDHGTAFDIAGQNVGDAEDMKAAMRFAVNLCRQQCT